LPRCDDECDGSDECVECGRALSDTAFASVGVIVWWVVFDGCVGWPCKQRPVSVAAVAVSSMDGDGEEGRGRFFGAQRDDGQTSRAAEEDGDGDGGGGGSGV